MVAIRQRPLPTREHYVILVDSTFQARRVKVGRLSAGHVSDISEISDNDIFLQRSNVINHRAYIIKRAKREPAQLLSICRQ